MKTTMMCRLCAAILITACSGSAANEPEQPKTDVKLSDGLPFTYTISPTQKVKSISAYLYGSNVEKGFSHTSKDVTTLVRMGGNRLTGYNWENNASNAGSDWKHSSDNFLEGTIEGADGNIPGSVVSTFALHCLQNGQTPLVTIPMSYRVAADKKGEVAPDDPTRWDTLLARKPTALSLQPDLTDRKVYADEMVAYLVNRVGGTGKLFYSLDNEPDLWSHTHPRICPTHISCADFVQRTIDFASAIKDVDPQSTIFGFVSYGYGGYVDFAGAPDWAQIRATGGYQWFIDYYLDQIARASKARGKNLVDVLDLHWYPEAQGDQRIVSADANSEADRAARLQAPRTLWDATYKEKSWIADQPHPFLPLLPKIMASIDKYCPGMKLAFTEFQYGGYNDITGTIALAETLGVLGKYGVYASNHWGNPGTYGLLAYDLYRNYDGNHSMFGSISVEATLNKNWVKSGIYASLADDGSLHLIVTNKDVKEKIAGTFVIDSGQYQTATIYGVTNGQPSVRKLGEAKVVANRFVYTLQPLSVVHIVVR